MWVKSEVSQHLRRVEAVEEIIYKAVLPASKIAILRLRQVNFGLGVRHSPRVFNYAKRFSAICTMPR